MDVLSPYINIHYNEGAEACFKNLEEKKEINSICFHQKINSRDP